MTIIDVSVSGDSDGAVGTDAASEHKLKQIQYSREVIGDIVKKCAQSLPDFRSDIMEKQADIAHLILVHGKEDQLDTKVVEAKESDSVHWDVEILSDLQQLTHLSADEQLMLLVNLLKVSREKMELMQSIIKHIEDDLKIDYPNCKVLLYGSSASGFAFQDCDLDAFIDLGLGGLQNIADACWGVDGVSGAQYTTRIIADRLRKMERFRSATPILHARTPIIKLKDRRTKIQCDLNVSCVMGVKNSEFLNFCRLMDQKCDYLIRDTR